VLLSARIDASKKNLNQLDAKLNTQTLVHQAKKKIVMVYARPSKELLGVHRALRKWLDLNLLRDKEDDPFLYDYELTVVTGGDEMKKRAILWLFGATALAIKDIEEARPRKRKAAPETGLFAELYRTYCRLSARSQISDDGPAIRFVAECAKLIDPGIKVPGGHALRERITKEIEQDNNKDYLQE
jgi:hypothetical protein